MVEFIRPCKILQENKMGRGTPDLSRAGKTAFVFEGALGDEVGFFTEYFATTPDAQAYATANGYTLIKKSRHDRFLGLEPDSVVDSDG